MRKSSNGHYKAKLFSATLKRDSGHVEYLANKKVEEKRCFWHHIVTRIGNFLISLAKRCLALKGADEIINFAHSSNCFGIIELLAKYDSLLPSYTRIRNNANRGKNHVTYLSFTTCEELQKLLGQNV